MKYFLNCMTIIFLLIVPCFAVDQIPIPENPAEYDTEDIVIDPESGDKFICNQVIVVFNTNVNVAQQKKILNVFQGKIVGGDRGMNIYHVSFPNTDRSLGVARRVTKRLKKNLSIVHAAPRQIEVENVEILDLSKRGKVKRRGTVEMEATGREEQVDKSQSMEYILADHKMSLFDCIKKTVKRHGAILYRISINPQGQVIGVKALQSDIKDKKIMDCLEYKIRQWENFPEKNVKFDRQVEFTFKY